MVSGLDERRLCRDIGVYPTADDLGRHGSDVVVRVLSKQPDGRSEHICLRRSTGIVLAPIAGQSVQRIKPRASIPITEHAHQLGEGLFVDQMIERLGAIHPHIGVAVPETTPYRRERFRPAQNEMPIRAFATEWVRQQLHPPVEVVMVDDSSHVDIVSPDLLVDKRVMP